ncbi:MAG: DUF4339 domain-containing protein [Phycisphaerales bacterium]
MWYYIINGQRFGPVDDDTIFSLIDQGTIQMRTFVWKAGMSDWTHAISTELSEKFFTVPPANLEIKEHLYTPDSLYKLWLWVASLDIFSTILVLMEADNYSIIPSIASVVLQCVLLYRFWSLIQDGRARTSPGQAVGFCFIPIFHIYWNYVAYVGLAQDMNLYCREKNISARYVNENLALVWFFLFLLSHVVIFFPNIWYFLGIPSLVVSIILMKQFVDISKEIIKSKSQ